MKKIDFENKDQYKSYIKEASELRIRDTQVGAILALILTCCGCFPDYFVYPQYFWKTLLPIHILWDIILLPILFLAYNKSFAKKYHNILSYILFMLIIIPMCCVIYITGGASSPYYVGLIVTMIGFSQLLRYTCFETIIHCLIIIIFYIAAVLLYNKSPLNISTFLNNIYFITVVSILCSIFSYYYTHYRVKEFKQRYEIAKKNKALKQAMEKLKASESQLVQSEKLNALGVLSAGMIHEIANPLNYAKGFTEILCNRITDSQHQKIIQKVHKGMCRIADIIDSMRNFAGNAKKSKHSFLLDDALQNALTLAGNKIKKIKIIQDIDKSRMVFGSKINITQVFLNLFINASDALENINRTPEIKISTYEKNNRLFITMKDNGVGIEKSDISNIFDPFFTTKDIGKGMGFGLSICYKIIKDHGEILKVDSKKEEWTQFSFSLPVSHSSDVF